MCHVSRTRRTFWPGISNRASPVLVRHFISQRFVKFYRRRQASYLSGNARHANLDHRRASRRGYGVPRHSRNTLASSIPPWCHSRVPDAASFLNCNEATTHPSVTKMLSQCDRNISLTPDSTTSTLQTTPLHGLGSPRFEPQKNSNSPPFATNLGYSFLGELERPEPVAPLRATVPGSVMDLDRASRGRKKVRSPLGLAQPPKSTKARAIAQRLAPKLPSLVRANDSCAFMGYPLPCLRCE
jgi:hypothetical protein